VVEKSKVLVLMDQVLPKRCVFSCYLKMAKDSVAQVELGRSFHSLGTVMAKVCESDFVPLLGWHHKVSFTCRTQTSGEHIGLK